MTDTGMFCAAAVGATVLAICAHAFCAMFQMLQQEDDETALEPTLENMPEIQAKAKNRADRRIGDRVVLGICWGFAGFLWIATIASAYRPS